jgi:hypothetical protein
MITIDDLKTIGLEEEKAKQALELLGDAAKKFTPENVGKKAFDEVDLAMLTLTKVPKNDNEKTTDYVKRANQAWLEGQITERTAQINEEITGLKEQLKNHKGDETLKARITALEEEKAKFPDVINEKTKEWKLKYEQTEKTFNDFKYEATLKSSMPAKFKDLPSKFIEYEKSQAITEAKQKFGKTETGSDGQLYLINETTYEKVKASDWFSERLKDIIDTGHTQAGGGSGDGQSTGGELILPPEMPKAEKIQKIEAYIVQSGISKIDPRFAPKFKELMIKNKLIEEKK